MFRGNHPATVDAKGRLKVPAAFLDALKQFGTQVFITSLDGGSASIYPIKVWEDIESRVHGLGALHPTRRRFSRATNAYGQQAELDAQNRLLLPQNLRTAANLVGKVDVLGLEHCLEVWNHATLFSQIEDEPITDEDLSYAFSKGG
ncbi:MAG: division/cell wall cluster transcriptional repressor MraZ [Acidobacteriota bacterium]|nr:division/cell wall cluster transcriptional repressor MraZ [Acidobacteriota bacterium]MDE3260565.1 division/cell wall cluster transcriptional repressor MraZ [Acidobacteriota bacterium]